jgi:uncharacterized membrane protein SpoIIM required for sporulation
MSAQPELEHALSLLELQRGAAPDRGALRQLPGLYRSAVAELAEARARSVPRRELEALEALVLRAHALLYAPEPPRLRLAFRDLMLAFPRQVRRCSAELGLATVLLVAGTVLGYLEVQRDAASAAVLLPGGLRDNAEESFQADRAPRDGDPIYGAFYFTNNAGVALRAYALGGTFGVGTALVLLFNGAVLGASFAVVGSVGSPTAFWSFVLPHGGLELFAILAAAAGGLRMARGLLQPGWSPRRESFVRAARESLSLALGASVLLAVAGLIEGWISPKALPIGVKAAIGVGVDSSLLAYLLLGARAASSDANAPSES